jgi:hypothetical protein
MALALFAGDDYEAFAARLMQTLREWGCWDQGWEVPTSGGSPRPGSGWVLSRWRTHDPLALDQPGGLVGTLAGPGAAGGALAGLGDLAELVVQRLDGIGGVEQLADRGAEGQERGEGVPGTVSGAGSRAAGY